MADKGRSFWCDGGFNSLSGLRLTFSRPVATVNPDGAAVAPNAPRMSKEVTIASAPVFTTVRNTSAPVQMIASGVDRDGVTPLLVISESQPARTLLDVFSVAGSQMAVAESTGAGRTRTVLGPANDLLNGQRPGKRYRISSGVVCHGLIVMYCTVSTPDNQGAWKESGGAFVVSQDRGASWELAYESESFAPGWLRGAAWSMQNWWPTSRGEAPTEAFFTATDYCVNPQSPGGNFFMLRAERPTKNDAWTIDPGVTAYSTSGFVGEHLHTGGVIPFSNEGIRAFIAIGDARRNNRIVSMTLSDHDYPSGAWVIQEDFHGTRGSPGVQGNQFVGCAPSPDPHTIIVGSDLLWEQLLAVHMDDTAPSHPVTTRLYGYSPSDGTGNTVFVVRSPTPERGGPYCANAEPFTNIPIPFSRRTLYSPDGVHWTQAAAPSGGYPVIHGPDIYFDGAPGQGIVRTPTPTVVTGRPMLIGPGGLQHQRTTPTIDLQGEPRCSPLTRGPDGKWQDNGVDLVPQPPCLGQVYKITTSISDSTPWIARFYPGTQADPFDRIIGDEMQVRFWVHQAQPWACASLLVGVGDSVEAPQIYRTPLLASIDSWIPVDATGFVRIAPGATCQLYVRAAGEIPDDQVIYMALDSVQEGGGAPGYPMPPDQSNPPRGTAYPDERASVTGFTCGEEWTITLAVQIPEDGFDFRSSLQTLWPITTIWGDASNYIEVIADTRHDELLARVVAGGRTSHTLSTRAGKFLRGSSLLLSFAQGKGTTPLEMTASVAGQGVRTETSATASAGRLLTSPREVRFFSQTMAPSSNGTGCPTPTLAIWGGTVHERVCLPRPTREKLLKDLSFLPGRRP